MCNSAHTDHVSTWKLFEYEIKLVDSIHFTMGKTVNRKKEKIGGYYSMSAKKMFKSR